MDFTKRICGVRWMYAWGCFCTMCMCICKFCLLGMFFKKRRFFFYQRATINASFCSYICKLWISIFLKLYIRVAYGKWITICLNLVLKQFIFQILSTFIDICSLPEPARISESARYNKGKICYGSNKFYILSVLEQTISVIFYQLFYWEPKYV